MMNGQRCIDSLLATALVSVIAHGAGLGCSKENDRQPPPIDAEKVAAARHPADSPFLALSFAEAQHRAQTDDKPILVDFYTDGCAPCKWMDAHTWNETSLVAWLDARAVCIKYNATDERSLAERYNVNAYPTLLVVDADGRELGRVKGGLDAAGVMKKLAPWLPAGE